MFWINYTSIKLEKYGLELHLRQGLGFKLVYKVRSRKILVLNQGWFASRAHVVISKDTLGCQSIWLVEIRDGAKYTMQKTAPHQKIKKPHNYSVHNVNSAQAEKHACRLSTTNWHLPLAAAICLYKDYIMLLLRLLILNTFLKGVQRENRNEALCALGKTGDKQVFR